GGAGAGAGAGLAAWAAAFGVSRIPGRAAGFAAGAAGAATAAAGRGAGAGFGAAFGGGAEGATLSSATGCVIVGAMTAVAPGRACLSSPSILFFKERSVSFEIALSVSKTPWPRTAQAS